LEALNNVIHDKKEPLTHSYVSKTFKRVQVPLRANLCFYIQTSQLQAFTYLITLQV